VHSSLLLIKTALDFVEERGIIAFKLQEDSVSNMVG